MIEPKFEHSLGSFCSRCHFFQAMKSTIFPTYAITLYCIIYLFMVAETPNFLVLCEGNETGNHNVGALYWVFVVKHYVHRPDT